MIQALSTHREYSLNNSCIIKMNNKNTKSEEITFNPKIDES